MWTLHSVFYHFHNRALRENKLSSFDFPRSYARSPFAGLLQQTALGRLCPQAIRPVRQLVTRWPDNLGISGRDGSPHARRWPNQGQQARRRTRRLQGSRARPGAGPPGAGSHAPARSPSPSPSPRGRAPRWPRLLVTKGQLCGF